MDIIWTDKKRWGLFGIPWTFTRYSLREDKLLIDTGLLFKRQDEIMLYRIMDLNLTRGPLQRMSKLGSIKVISSDKSCPELVIKNIKNSQDVKEQLSNLVEKARDKKRVYSREIINGPYEDDETHEWF